MAHKYHKAFHGIGFEVSSVMVEHLTCITKWHMTIIFNPSRLVVLGVPDDIC